MGCCCSMGLVVSQSCKVSLRVCLCRNVVNALSEASNNAHPTRGETPIYTTFGKVRGRWLPMPVSGMQSLVDGVCQTWLGIGYCAPGF